MSDELKPPEQMTDEELERVNAAFDEQSRVIQEKARPYATELEWRKCEANPYLKLLREGAVIEVEWEDDIGTTFYINREEVEYSCELSDLEFCPQVDDETVNETYWRKRVRLVLVEKGETE